MIVATIAAIVSTAVVGSGAIATAGHFARKFTRKVDTFLADWNGEPARPGVPEKRGVMVRLEAIEAELSYNSGATLKDAVHRIDRNLAALLRNTN